MDFRTWQCILVIGLLGIDVDHPNSSVTYIGHGIDLAVAEIDGRAGGNAGDAAILPVAVGDVLLLQAAVHIVINGTGRQIGRASCRERV